MSFSFSLSNINNIDYEYPYTSIQLKKLHSFCPVIGCFNKKHHKPTDECILLDERNRIYAMTYDKKFVSIRQYKKRIVNEVNNNNNNNNNIVKYVPHLLIATNPKNNINTVEKSPRSDILSPNKITVEQSPRSDILSPNKITVEQSPRSDILSPNDVLNRKSPRSDVLSPNDVLNRKSPTSNVNNFNDNSNEKSRKYNKRFSPVNIVKHDSPRYDNEKNPADNFVSLNKYSPRLNNKKSICSNEIYKNFNTNKSYAYKNKRISPSQL